MAPEGLREYPFLNYWALITWGGLVCGIILEHGRIATQRRLALDGGAAGAGGSRKPSLGECGTASVMSAALGSCSRLSETR